MEDKKQVMSWLEGLTFDEWHMYHSDSEVQEIAKNAFELLKEQDEQKRKWLQAIADNQLANAPTDTMDATQHTYYDGVWNGLQKAWDILTKGR